jgi:uncharacterized protein (TIGR03437 family)
MTLCEKLFCAALFTAGIAGAAPTIRSGGVVNAASHVPPGLPNYGIARGGIFIVSGDNLGPEQLLEARFPLTTSAGGTSVQVTVGETTIDGIIVYTSAKAVSAILPSKTPVGDGFVVVTYNGQKSAPAKIHVTHSNFGIFTMNDSGSGPAVAKNATLDGPQVNTLTETARPGQTMSIYGTGLGPVEFPETGAAKQEDLNLDVEVYVGSRKAYVLYKGRSSCCAGADQIDFIVPESVEGCYVPVVVKVGDAISNFATVSVDPDGKPCSNPSGISAADRDRLQTAGSFRLGSISLYRNSTRTAGASPSANVNQNTETAAAGFLQYDQSQVQSANNQYGLSPGACTVFTFRFDVDDSRPAEPFQPALLDAGPVIEIAGPKGSKQLVRQGGNYWATLGGIGAPDYLEAGTYTADNGAGGSDVGAFRETFKIAEPLAWLEADSLRAADRAQGLNVKWTGGDPDGIVSIVGVSTKGLVGAQYTCSERVKAGQFTVPPVVLLSLPPAESGDLSMTASTDHRFVAPGLDAAYITSSTSTARTLAYR